MKVAMSESPEVCQFPPTEAISPHCYNVSASNWKQSLKFGTFAFTNFVKLNVYLWRLSQHYMHFFCMFHPSAYFWGNNHRLSPAHNRTSNVPHAQLFSPYRTIQLPKGTVWRFPIATLHDSTYSCMHRAACIDMRNCYYLHAVSWGLIKSSAGNTLDIPNAQLSLKWIGTD